MLFSKIVMLVDKEKGNFATFSQKNPISKPAGRLNALYQLREIGVSKIAASSGKRLSLRI